MTQTAPETPVATTRPRIPDDSTFGARLALVRQLMSWGNVAEAAKECGLPVDSWRHWERDNMEPRRLVTIAVAIATRANVDLDWLVYGPNKPVLSDARPGGRLNVEYPVRLRPLDQRVIGRTMPMPVHRDGRRKPNGRLANLNDRSAGDQRSVNRTLRSSLAARGLVAS